LLLFPLFRYSGWDERVALHYWNEGGQAWRESADPLAGFLYRFGPWPALLAGLCGGAAFFLSYADENLRRWRGPGLFLFLLLLLGPGLLVNGLGKSLAGRPRPSDVTGFGGAWNFQPLGNFGTPGRGQSFPSGHASTGFYWVALFFLLRRRWLGLLTGLLAGAAMSWTRIVQGGHFLSDTLAAGAVVFTLAAALSPLIHWQPPAKFWRQGPVLWVLAAGALAYLSISQVVYEERDFHWTQDPAVQAGQPTQRLQVWNDRSDLKKVSLLVSLEHGDLHLNFNATAQSPSLPLSLEERFLGQGFPGAKDTVAVEPLAASAFFEPGPGHLGFSLVQQLRGAWWSAEGRYALQLPADKLLDLRLKTAHGVLTIGSLPKGRQILLLGALNRGSLPPGFEPQDQHSWLRDGAQPQIALDLDAPDIRFEP
jgi:membrane-associated PAP2 superfamily phosphatase